MLSVRGPGEVILLDKPLNVFTLQISVRTVEAEDIFKMVERVKRLYTGISTPNFIESFSIQIKSV